MTDLQWWTPIPWLIGLAGLAVAIAAFRRSRYQVVRVRILCAGYFLSSPDREYHAHLWIDVICIGADIFDPEVYLELDDVSWVRMHRAGWMPRRRYRTKAKFLAKTAKPVSSPLKNGQAVRFVLTDHEVQSTALRNADWKLPSQRWPTRARVAIYHSGNRLLTSRASWRFYRQLRAFDIGSRQAIQLQRTALSTGDQSSAGAPDA